jgi:Ribbon-helix-helix protein, copG family
MVKVTFTFDDQTVSRLRRAAARLHMPQSQVVREAIADYADRVGRLSDRERLRLLAALDRIAQRRPTRPAAEVDEELRAIRMARRRGGRRHGA